MKVTIYDVAKRANVSIATVSRVMSGRARVTESTRARVLQAIQELNYHPDPVAQGLATQTTRTFGLIIEQFDEIYPGKIITGAQAEAAEHGYHLLVHRIAGLDANKLADLMRRVDGAIVSGMITHEDLLQALSQMGKPVVIFSSKREDLHMDGVYPLNAEGAYAAVKHLIEHGYRRIAHIVGPEGSLHARDRLAAYQTALKDHGLEFRSEYVVRGNYTSEGGYKAMLQLLDLPEPPDAVFCSNDLTALGALLAIEENGLAVPEDIALVGFDGLETGAFVNPPLTTVYQPMEDIGRNAVRLLLWRLENPEAPLREIALPTRLLIRQSCGCEAVAQAQADASVA